MVRLVQRYDLHSRAVLQFDKHTARFQEVVHDHDRLREIRGPVQRRYYKKFVQHCVFEIWPTRK